MTINQIQDAFGTLYLCVKKAELASITGDHEHVSESVDDAMEILSTIRDAQVPGLSKEAQTEANEALRVAVKSAKV